MKKQSIYPKVFLVGAFFVSLLAASTMVFNSRVLAMRPSVASGHHSPVPLFVAAVGDACEKKESDGSTYPGTKNSKDECVIFQTGGKKPGDPGVIYCGDTNKNAVVISIDIGCKHAGNAILDALFAVIRFLTLGVSLVIIGSMVVAGIQFTASRGDPQATGAALKRMSSSASALLLFIFIYAILNWLVPNTLLQ